MILGDSFPPVPKRLPRPLRLWQGTKPEAGFDPYCPIVADLDHPVLGPTAVAQKHRTTEATVKQHVASHIAWCDREGIEPSYLVVRNAVIWGCQSTDAKV